MTAFKHLASSLNDYVLLLTRVVVGYMFLLHGTAKFFEFPVSMTGGNGAVPLLSVFGVGGVLEIVGGVLLMLGLFVRPVAFLLAGQMAVAYFVFHAGVAQIFDPMSNKGEAAALYCMVFLLFWLNGAGKFSLDNKLCKA
ncbi:DoxX family protein [Moraxella pluranimalium]|uniref:DoxX family protein n=1 Tax=Moraxella pluranimalium TaxID=470453 RepID=A0A1T0CU43_9GAMM|nr:DoxX family protein [Moraxella pluranimalium]OOS25641.1 hypothetical protein B0680_02110 [Moraxella pluranimalium]